MGKSNFTVEQKEEYERLIADIPEERIAWFAGWLCADGSIKNAGPNPARPVIRFTITDKDPLEIMASLFGNAVSGPYKPHGLGVKAVYEWRISGRRAAVILRRVEPWLSERYKDRMKLALEGFSDRGHCGKKLSPEQVEEIRSRLSEGTRGLGKRLAEEFGVTDGMISAIKTGRSW